MISSSRSNRRLAISIASTFLGVLAFCALALADAIVGDANRITPTDNTVESSRTVSPGSTGNGAFGLVATGANSTPPDSSNGCNASGSTPVILRVSSNQSWVTFGATAPGTSTVDLSITDCDTGGTGLADGLQNARSFTYRVAAGAPANSTATVTATYLSGGKSGATSPSNYTSGSFTVQTPAPANTAPSTPGKPGLSGGSGAPNRGIFGLEWRSSNDAESNSITYRLEHQDADDAGYSLVTGAGSLSSASHSFTAGSPEAEGTWTYRVRASDGTLTSGFSSASDPVKVDQTGPSTPDAATDPSSPQDGTGGWFKDTVTVSYSGSTDPALDDGSDGSGVADHSDPETFNTSGTHNYSGKATDNAGNESTARSGEVKVDATEPQVSIDSGCPTGLVARNSAHSVSVSASDEHSDLDQDPSGSHSLDTSTPGSHKYTATATDNVGHEASADCEYTVNAEPSAPGKPALAAGFSSPNDGIFELTWDAADDDDGNLDHYVLRHKDADDAGYSDVPGGANITPSANPSFEFTSGSPEDEGTWTYKVVAVDALDEASDASPASDPVKVDQTGPSTPDAATDPSSPQDGTGGWFKDTVTVSYSGSTDPALDDGSDGSGVADHSDPETFNTSGTHNYSGKATDNAGNESTARSGEVKVDATEPSLQLSGCPGAGAANGVEIGSSTSITVTTRDAHSGLVSDPTGPQALDTSTVGAKTKTIDVEDRAGHKVSASCSYHVVFDWSGFFAPVDNPETGKMNGVKAGSAVPIKFSLAGNRGLSIFAAGSPSSKQFNCAGGGDLSTDTPAVAAGSSSLSYDATTGQYTYVWKTDKSWAGTCRRLTLTLTDGTVHTADFKQMK